MILAVSYRSTDGWYRISPVGAWFPPDQVAVAIYKMRRFVCFSDHFKAQLAIPTDQVFELREIPHELP